MPPQLQAAIAAIQPLSPTERQQLMTILTQSDVAPHSQTNFKAFSSQFWQGTPLQQLRVTQTPTPFYHKTLTADFWPEEDSIEDFLTCLQQQRQDPQF